MSKINKIVDDDLARMRLERIARENPRESKARDEDFSDDGERYADGIGLDDFYAYMPMHSYIFVPSREMWPASSVNAQIRR